MSSTIEAAPDINEGDQTGELRTGPKLHVVETGESQELAKELDACRETTWRLAESVGLDSEQASALEGWIVDGTRPEEGGDLYKARDAIQWLVKEILEGEVQIKEEEFDESGMSGKSRATLNALLQYRLPVEPYEKTHSLEETRRALDIEFGYGNPVTMLEVVQLQHLGIRTLAEGAAAARDETEQSASTKPSPVEWLRASKVTLPKRSPAEEGQTEITNGHAPCKSSGDIAESVSTREYDLLEDDRHIAPSDNTLHSIDGIGEVDGKVRPIAPRKGRNGHTTRKRKPKTTEQASGGATTNGKSRQPTPKKLPNWLGGPQPWAEFAKCSEEENPDIFFPPQGGSVKAGKLICSLCEVRQECLDFALEHDERFGVWGGLSERERRTIKHMQK